MRVLIVEGNPRLRERVIALLDDSSDVEHVATDDVAIVRLQQAAYDVVIVGLCMPGDLHVRTVRFVAARLAIVPRLVILLGNAQTVSPRIPDARQLNTSTLTRETLFEAMQGAG